MLILALESSTSSAKAMLYDTDLHKIIAAESTPYPQSVYSGGIADTEAVFALTARMGQQVAAGKSVDAISICGTWHSIAVCDKDLKPTIGTYSWEYMGSGRLCAKTRLDLKLTDELYTRTGCMPHITYPRQVLAHLREEGHDLSASFFPSQGAYDLYRLTGIFAETPCTMSGSGLLNISDLEYDELALTYAGIKAYQLGTLVTYKNTFPLNEEGARLLGLRSGIPVVPAHADGALNQISANAALPGRMTLSVGTSAAIRMSVSAPVKPDRHQLWNYYGANGHIAGAATAGACNCIDWFKKSVLGNRFSFEELTADFDGSKNLPVFLPFLFGERCPGWNDDLKGGFSDLKPDQDLVTMFKGIQAGVLMNLYQCYKVLTAEVGTPEVISVSGGILNSKPWVQMLADIFKTKVQCVDNPNASTMGAVILGMHAAGVIDDIRGCDEGVMGITEVSPIESHIEYYEKLYNRYQYRYIRAIER